MTTEGTVTEATVMGLMPFTNYDCYVTANTSVGEGPPSEAKTQRTEGSGECVLVGFDRLLCVSVCYTLLHV